MIATLGAPERRRLLAARRKQREAPAEPAPAPVSTGRATIIDVGDPLADEQAAARWLERASHEYLDAGVEVLNRALHAFRLVTADPYVNGVSVSSALVSRIGYGAGEQVADGLWSSARELPEASSRQRRLKLLQPQARLAAVLTGRVRPLACEELALRARLDLDSGRPREAALQLLVALDAALAELAADPSAKVLGERLAELRAQREPIGKAAQAALGGSLSPDHLETVQFTLGRIEAALRARAVATA